MPTEQFIKQIRRRKHFQELEECGVSVERYFAIQGELSKRGVTLCYRRSGEWIMGAVNLPGAIGADHATATLGTGALAKLLLSDDPARPLFEALRHDNRTAEAKSAQDSRNWTAMDLLNDGGADNPAQFSNDNG